MSGRRADAQRDAEVEAFVRAHAPALSVLAGALSASPADAQDLLQESLVRVLERWERVAAARDRYAYVRRVVVTTAATRWRRQQRQPRRALLEVLAPGAALVPAVEAAAAAQAPASAGASPERSVLLAEQRTELLAALRALPPRQRTVVVLRYLEAMPDEQVAAAMGISAGTVRSSALRALRVLRAVEGLAPDP